MIGPRSGQEAETAAPLILTLAMDEASQERFDRLHRAFFPPERNLIPAHLTLFHHLPEDRAREVVATVEEACRRQEPLTLKAVGLLFMGRGVAYRLDSPGLVALRKRLTGEWEPWLGVQDLQDFRPHVTVQNKVTKEEARDLHDRLQSSFSPFEVAGKGLSLWRYLGGPWRPVGTYPFLGQTTVAPGGRWPRGSKVSGGVELPDRAEEHGQEAARGGEEQDRGS